MTPAPTTQRRPLCRHAQCAGYADGCLVADLAWSERDRLIAIARSRVASAAEAEDVVSEAMTRALECPDVDPTRAAAWLTAVTIRLCIDHVRDRARAPKRWQYAAQTYSPTHEFEADVVDTLSAAAIAPLLDDMPTQQRRALQLRADGEPVAAIAAEMSLSEKAVESLLGRARAAARSIVAGLGSAAAMIFGWARQSEPADAVLSTAVAVAMTTIVAAHLGGTTHEVAPAGTAPVARSVVAVHAMEPARSVRLLGEAMRSVADVAPSFGSLTSPASADAAARPSQEVAVGTVKVRDSGSGRERTDESVVESVRACVAGGIEVSTTYIGCRSSKPHQR